MDHHGAVSYTMMMAGPGSGSESTMVRHVWAGSIWTTLLAYAPPGLRPPLCRLSSWRPRRSSIDIAKDGSSAALNETEATGSRSTRLMVSRSFSRCSLAWARFSTSAHTSLILSRATRGLGSVRPAYRCQ